VVKDANALAVVEGNPESAISERALHAWFSQRAWPARARKFSAPKPSTTNTAAFVTLWNPNGLSPPERALWQLASTSASLRGVDTGTSTIGAIL
jgi:hypothetical protein